MMKGQLDSYWAKLGKKWAEQNLEREHKPSRQKRRQQTAQKLIALVKDISNPKILEVGCNYGGNLHHLIKSKAEIHGIDISPDGIKEAKKLLGDRAQLKVGTLFDLPYEDNTFDVVFSVGVLIHIHPNDLPRALTEIARVSKRWVAHVEFGGTHGIPKGQSVLSNKKYSKKRFQYVFGHKYGAQMYTGYELKEEEDLQIGNLVWSAFEQK